VFLFSLIFDRWSFNLTFNFLEVWPNHYTKPSPFKPLNGVVHDVEVICLVNVCVLSSRSHLIFMITVRGQDKASGAVSTGTLTLCDLAGSERVSKSEATGQRLTEAAAINKSLSALGQVRRLMSISLL